MRRFYLDRGARGCVAQGCLFTDGTTVLHWLGDVGSTAIYPTIAAFKSIHVEGHEGTRIRWHDKVCFACGATVDFNHGRGGCCYCGASWDEPVDEKNPALGSWKPALTIGGDDAAPK